MIHLTFRTQILLVTMPLLTLLASSNTNAEIYKWRDNRGVTQYSDRPPVSSALKLTANELVNSLQTKDLCTVGPIKKAAANIVASTRDYSVFFNIFTQANPMAKKSSVLSSAPVVTAVNILSIPATKRSTIATASLPNVITTPTTPASNKPVSTAPTATSPVTTAPTQVATAPSTSNALNLPNIIQAALMPAVDISKNIVPAIGFDTVRIQNTTDSGTPNSDGAFRIPCKLSHMSNDDPIVYPNQQGAAHHHTFFGNTSLNYNSNLMNLSSTGNSTCPGGIANRSAYWVPSVIDTTTNTPIPPDDAIFYYKNGFIDGSLIQAPPKGLRMIAGDSKAATETTAASSYSCTPGPKSTRKGWALFKSFPKDKDCEIGDVLTVQISFPQCWDGKNLDSPNHKDHMAFPSHRTTSLPNFYCPSTHPIAIPSISYHIMYNMTKSNQTVNWRLASDNYSNSLPGGYSMHADWVNGWDEKVMAGIVKNCINGKRDGHAFLLCDGKTLY